MRTTPKVKYDHKITADRTSKATDQMSSAIELHSFTFRVQMHVDGD